MTLITLLILTAGLVLLLVACARCRNKKIYISADIKVNEKLITTIHLKVGEYVTLWNRPGTAEVRIFAKGFGIAAVAIAVVNDEALSNVVDKSKADAKVVGINGDVITLRLKYSLVKALLHPPVLVRKAILIK